VTLSEPGRVFIGKVGAEHVSISIEQRNPDGWLRGIVEVSAGPWGGCCGAYFYHGELRRFASEIDRLYEELKGTAELVPMEPNLSLRFSGNGRGLIAVEGTAQDISQNSSLSFKLELDQTELPLIATSLRVADPE